MAAVLACGPGAVLSHHAAAALWDLRPIPQSKIDVTASGKRAHAGVRCHISPLDPRDCSVIDGKLQLAGYQVLRYTYDDLDHDAPTVAAEIRDALVGSPPPTIGAAPG